MCFNNYTKGFKTSTNDTICYKVVWLPINKTYKSLVADFEYQIDKTYRKNLFRSIQFTISSIVSSSIRISAFHAYTNYNWARLKTGWRPWKTDAESMGCYALIECVIPAGTPLITNDNEVVATSIRAVRELDPTNSEPTPKI